MYDCTEDGENKGQTKWITTVYLCSCWENFLSHTIVLYLPLPRKLVGVSFPDPIPLYPDVNLTQVFSMWLETTMERKERQSENEVELTLWQISQNITNIPSAQGIPGSTESHPLQHQLLRIKLHVCKNHYTFFQISTDFQCWSCCDRKKSTYFNFNFLASECQKFFLLKYFILKVNAKKLLYQNKRANHVFFYLML